MVHAVWHGTQEKYQIFDTLGGRFNSEFGMEAFPHIDTIRYYCTDPTQLYPQSHMLDFHNKADGHERRIATYLVENFRTKTDLEVRTLSICAVICSYVTGGAFANKVFVLTLANAVVYPSHTAVTSRSSHVWL
jgi:hypothetical protein